MIRSPFKTKNHNETDGGSEEYSSTVEGSDDSPIWDNDLRNIEVVYDEHDSDPLESLRIIRYDEIPMAKGDDEVVIKVEASTVSIDDCRIRDGSYKWRFEKNPNFLFVPEWTATEQFYPVVRKLGKKD